MVAGGQGGVDLRHRRAAEEVVQGKADRLGRIQLKGEDRAIRDRVREGDIDRKSMQDGGLVLRPRADSSGDGEAGASGAVGEGGGGGLRLVPREDEGLLKRGIGGGIDRADGEDHFVGLGECARREQRGNDKKSER